jgi:hypothetical protein
MCLTLGLTAIIKEQLEIAMWISVWRKITGTVTNYILNIVRKSKITKHDGAKISEYVRHIFSMNKIYS